MTTTAVLNLAQAGLVLANHMIMIAAEARRVAVLEASKLDEEAKAALARLDDEIERGRRLQTPPAIGTLG